MSNLTKDLESKSIPYLGNCPECGKYVVRGKTTNIKNARYYCRFCKCDWVKVQ